MGIGNRYFRFLCCHNIPLDARRQKSLSVNLKVVSQVPANFVSLSQLYQITHWASSPTGSDYCQHVARRDVIYMNKTPQFGGDGCVEGVDESEAEDSLAELCSEHLGGGAEGTRTPYLLLAKQALSQMSYSPTRNRAGVVGRQVGKRRGQNNRAGYC